MKFQKAFIACASIVAIFAACSDDSSDSNTPISPENPDAPIDAISSQTDDVLNSSSATVQIHSSSSMNESITNMAITEIMYNAPDNSELEWVEVTIAAGPDIKSMKLVNLHLGGAVSYYFPAEPLAKGEYVVVTNNVELFKATYPNFTGRLFGPWDTDPATKTAAKLTNEGDVIDIKITKEGDASCSYSKDPPWPSLANGKGRTLVYKGGNAAQPDSWGASKILGGAPGVGNDEWLETSKVRLNEIMPTTSASPAWVELYNAGSEAVDVTGWTFESKIRLDTLTINSGVVPAGGYLVLDGATAFDKELIVSPIGGSYYLRGNTEGDESSLLLPSSELSSGVVEVGDGSVAQGALQVPTPGAANSKLYVGSLIINEINYHPVDDNPNQVEFLELKNIGTESINLYVNVSGANKGWKVEGINMEFASGDILPAGGIAVLFPDSLSAIGIAKLREKFAIDESVMIKFYKGKLSNRGEMVAVKKPYYYQEDTTNPVNSQWYYDWSDATLYSDGWSGNNFNKTDGLGFSLQRKDVTTMGYGSAAWIAAEPTPGK